jgi:hypothetical protein
MNKVPATKNHENRDFSGGGWVLTVWARIVLNVGACELEEFYQPSKKFPSYVFVHIGHITFSPMNSTQKRGTSVERHWYSQLMPFTECDSGTTQKLPIWS